MPAEDFYFRHDLRVRFPETDAQGVVYHANFLIYCDVARIEWFRVAGHERDEWLRDAGFDIVLVHAGCDFRSSARFDDALTVWMRLKHVGQSSFSFAYRVERGETLVCEAKTVHVTIDRHTRQKISIPDEAREFLIGREASLARAGGSR
jgi:acyl-CoA thioester hydrolase